MIISDNEIYALRAVHQHLQLDERVSLFGRCRLKSDATKSLFRLSLLSLVPILLCVCSQLFVLLELIGGFAVICLLMVLAMSFYGRSYGFCALTDRRLLQCEDGNIKEIASRNEVREIVGTDNRLTLIVAIEKNDATAKDRRLGKSKTCRRIELSPSQRFFEAVGGKELLTDTTNVEKGI